MQPYLFGQILGMTMLLVPYIKVWYYRCKQWWCYKWSWWYCDCWRRLRDSFINLKRKKIITYLLLVCILKKSSTIFRVGRSSHLRCFIKKVFLKIFKVSQENTRVGISFRQSYKACNFNKKSLQYRCFPLKLAKFLRTPILKNSCEWLLLNRPYEC